MLRQIIDIGKQCDSETSRRLSDDGNCTAVTGRAMRIGSPFSSDLNVANLLPWTMKMLNSVGKNTRVADAVRIRRWMEARLLTSGPADRA